MTGAAGFVTRAQWGAKPSKGEFARWRVGSPSGNIVHWVGAPVGLADDHSKCDDRVRGLQAGAQNGEYVDIPYNTLFCPHGFVYEGRGLGWASAANGAGTNGTKASHCFLGGPGDPFPEAAHDALLDLCVRVRGDSRPHRDVASTACPGDVIVEFVRGPLQFGTWVLTHQVPEVVVTPPPPGFDPRAFYKAMHDLGNSIKSGPILKRDATGQAVRDVQMAAVAGFDQTLVVDGRYGGQTLSAVMNIQGFFHLTTDGIVGPKTRGVLSFGLLHRYP